MTTKPAWIPLFEAPRATYAWIVTALAALLLLATAAPDILPGDAATLVAQHAGIDVFAPLSHHVWGWLGAIVDTLPLGTLGFRWNLLSALCGAACCGLLVLLGARLPALNPRWSLMVGSPRAMANLAGLAAGLLLLGSLPFRIASAIALPATLELLALLTATWLLVRYAESRRFPLATASCALFSLTATQSPSALIAAPVFLLALILAVWRAQHIRPAQLAALAASLTAPGLLLLGAATAWFGAQPGAAWIGLDTTGSVFYQLILEVYIELRYGTPGLALVLVSIYSLIPFLMCLFLTSGRGEGKALLMPLVLALGALLFLNFRFSLFPLFGLRPLLVTPYALAALWFGYLAAYLIGATHAASQVNFRLRRNPQLGRAIATTGLAALALFILVAGGLSHHRLQLREALAITRHADQLARDLPDDAWIVLHGDLDPLIRIKAHEHRHTPLFISAHRLSHQPYQRALADALASPRLASLIDAGLVPLLRERWHPDQAPAPTLAVLGDPGLLRFVVNTAWPDRVFYASAEPPDLTPDAYAARQRAWWQGFGPIADHPYADLERRLHTMSARVANDAGVWLQDRGADDLAREAYREAFRIDPDNLSARLNLRALTADDAPDAPTLDAEIETLSARLRGRATLTRIMDLHGTIRHEAASVAAAQRWNRADPADTLDPRLANLFAQPDDPAALAKAREIAANDPAALLNLARLANGRQRPNLARLILNTLPDAGPFALPLRIERAQTALLLGEPDTAYQLLATLPENDLNDPRALILLALLTVETKPADCDRYLQQLEAFPDRLPDLSLPIARIYETRGNRPAAIHHLTHLTSIQPLNTEAHRTLIRLHLEQDDRPAAYAAARPLLALDARDPWANTALALHLAQTNQPDAATAAQTIALTAAPTLQRFFTTTSESNN